MTERIHYREPKAMRLHLEQLEKRIRQDAQRDEAVARRQALLDRASQLRREAERAEQQAAALEAQQR